MKAMLEIDVPKSCSSCRLCVSGSCAGRNWNESNTTTPMLTERAPFCPLKIVPEHVCATIDNILRTPEDLQLKLHETTQKIVDKGSVGFICAIL